MNPHASSDHDNPCDSETFAVEPFLCERDFSELLLLPGGSGQGIRQRRQGSASEGASLQGEEISEETLGCGPLQLGPDAMAGVREQGECLQANELAPAAADNLRRLKEIFETSFLKS